jgi:hypothetical protein
MARTITILTAALFALSSGALAQSGQSVAQAGAGANAQAGVQAGRTSAQTSADTSANANASGKQSEQEGSLSAGRALNAELDHSIDSKKAKAGDSITARTTEAVKENGKTVIPKGSKLVGHVTKASAKANGDAESMLAVQFDHAILKGGREVPLQASIQALAVAQGAAAAAVGGDDLQPMPNAGGAAMGGGPGRGAGATPGVGSTVGATAGAAAGTVQRTTAAATGAASSTANGAANVAGGAGTGLGAGGQLISTSRGVFGMSGLALNSSANSSAEGSVISSAGKNVHLDSGTRMLLVAQVATAASAQR